MGDMLLRHVTDRLRAVVRETDTIARLGGDEFAIVQTGIALPQDAAELAQRLNEVIAAPYDLDGHYILVGASVGIAVAPGDGMHADVLLSNADLALYRSKASGRGRFCFFEPEMNDHAQSRLANLVDLRSALKEGQFELFYQPQVSLPSRRIVGFEALLRWRHPERGLIPPDRFIPLAEESGLIAPIGAWALRHACMEASRWPAGLRVAVNISAVQIGNPTFVNMVKEILCESGLHGSRLEIEITETVLLRDTDTTLSVLHRLRDLGVAIALDDFGTGYSSLSYLQRFPFDRVKLDRSFIMNLGHAETNDAIVRCVMSLCSAVDISITAEGVENEEQLSILVAGGCDEAQGYLFGAPHAAPDIPEILSWPAEETSAERPVWRADG
jgi:predicted signal transduction protein with EAL and GGDEF domain